jgi:hypothetical protein
MHVTEGAQNGCVPARSSSRRTKHACTLLMHKEEFRPYGGLLPAGHAQPDRSTKLGHSARTRHAFADEPDGGCAGPHAVQLQGRQHTGAATAWHSACRPSAPARKPLPTPRSARVHTLRLPAAPRIARARVPTPSGPTPATPSPRQSQQPARHHTAGRQARGLLCVQHGMSGGAPAAFAAPLQGCRVTARRARRTHSATTLTSSRPSSASPRQPAMAALPFFAAAALHCASTVACPVAFLNTWHVSFSLAKHLTSAFRGMSLPSAPLAFALASGLHAPALKSLLSGKQGASGSPFLVSARARGCVEHTGVTPLPLCRTQLLLARPPRTARTRCERACLDKGSAVLCLIAPGSSSSISSISQEARMSSGTGGRK